MAAPARTDAFGLDIGAPSTSTCPARTSSSGWSTSGKRRRNNEMTRDEGGVLFVGQERDSFPARTGLDQAEEEVLELWRRGRRHQRARHTGHQRQPSLR